MKNVAESAAAGIMTREQENLDLSQQHRLEVGIHGWRGAVDGIGVKICLQGEINDGFFVRRWFSGFAVIGQPLVQLLVDIPVHRPGIIPVHHRTDWVPTLPQIKFGAIR